jgi:hypothetical protein
LWFCSPMLPAAIIIADPPSWASLHLASFNSAPVLELAHPCKSTQKPKQDRHYRWDRCGCLYDTPQFVCSLFHCCQEPHWSHSTDLPEPCSPPFNAHHHPDEEISVWKFHTIVHRFLYPIWLLRAATQTSDILWLIKPPTTPIHPATTITDPPEKP